MNKKMFQKVLIACIGFLIFVTFMAMIFHRFEETSSEPVTADTENKVVYLTFDDGPSQNTEAILNILKEEHVKATFFVTGQFPEYEGLIKTEAEQGHAIGVHTYSHDYAQIYASVDAYFKDIEEANEMIKRQTSKTSNLLRFPGGTSNTISRQYCSGIMSQLSKEAIDRGFQYYDWNAENGDGNTGLDADTLIDTAQREVEGQTNVMMLMHDGGGSGETVKALPAIIKNLKEQGFTFAIIDETTPVFHHHIAN